MLEKPLHPAGMLIRIIMNHSWVGPIHTMPIELDDAKRAYER